MVENLIGVSKKYILWAIAFLGAIFCCLYIQVCKDDVVCKASLSKTFASFNLTLDDVQGIIAFILIFFVIVSLVSKVLVTPYVKLNTKREDLTINKINEANIFLQEASKLQDEFLKKANEEKRIALTQKAIILTEARREAENVIFQTENEISYEIASAKERIDLKTKIMLNELVLKKQEFSDALKEKVLNI